MHGVTPKTSLEKYKDIAKNAREANGIPKIFI